VALIAGLILAAESTRNHAPLELAVLVAALVVVALAAWHLQAAFRATPANFPVLHAPAPDPTPADTLRTGYRKSKEARH
jgi:hypothetical protein